jgi:hypothetical protein
MTGYPRAGCNPSEDPSSRITAVDIRQKQPILQAGMVRLHARERRSVLYQPKPELNVGKIENTNATVSDAMTKFENYSVNNQSDQNVSTM